MAKIELNRVTNANIYMDSANLLGRAEEVSLPQVKHKMVDHKALGMVATAEFFSGIDKLEMKIKWASFYAEVLKKAANPFKSVKLQVRSSIETYGGAGKLSEVPVVVQVSGAFKEFPLGNFKQHENVELETTLTAYYTKLSIDGADIFEIDVLNNIYKVDGVDMLADYRKNIGG